MTYKWTPKHRWAMSSGNGSIGLLDLIRGPVGRIAPRISIPPVKVRPPSLSYTPFSRQEFWACDYDLSEIGRALDTDSLIRRSVSKHVTLCLKEGWDIVGKDPDTLEYIRKRLFEFEMATSICFDSIVRDVVQNVVTYSNSFLVFKRDVQLSSGSTYKKFGRMIEPIAGIFNADPSSMRIKRNKFGEVKEYQQVIQGDGYIATRSKKFNKDDVYHLTYDRKTGYAWGTPFIIPVLDDVRLLRNLEELSNLVCHKSAFPLYHYAIGTDDLPAIDYEGGASEITKVEEEILGKETEGMFVSSHRHTISNVDGSAKVRDLTNYLKYFEQRVISGLNLSGVDLGRGDTANRGTATAMSKGIQNQCKDFQQAITSALQGFFDDLLTEGGIRITTRNRVSLHWPEIDIETQQIKQNHKMALYQGHALTQNEMRIQMGMEPLTEEQDNDMFFNIVERERIREQALAKAFGAPSGSAENTTASKNKPANQYGTKQARGTRKNDHILLEERLKNVFDTVEQIVMEDGLPENTNGLASKVAGLLFDATSDILMDQEDLLGRLEASCILLHGVDKDDWEQAFRVTKSTVAWKALEMLGIDLWQQQ